MAGKADFTEDEWKTLSKGVTGTGMLVSLAHKDFTDSFGEATALAKEMANQHTHNQSQLVRELGGTRGTGFGITASPAKVQAETIAALDRRCQPAQDQGTRRARGLSCVRAGHRPDGRRGQGRRGARRRPR